jgi:hypothetical protein
MQWLSVWIVAGLRALVANEAHHLVLALAGHVRVGEDDLDRAPRGIGVDLARDKEANRLGDALHKRRAGRDAVGVEAALAGGRHLDAARLKLVAQSRFDFANLFRFARRFEATSALLVHFGARRDAVDRHVEHATRTRHVENKLDIFTNGNQHFIFGFRSRLLRGKKDVCVE